MDIGVPQSWRNEQARYRLIGSWCGGCNEGHFPSRLVCPSCNKTDKLSKKQFKGTGKVVSYSVVYAPPTGFKLRVPYTLALIKLDEGPTVLGMVSDTTENEVTIGAKVEKIFRRWAEGRDENIIHYGFSFRLV